MGPQNFCGPFLFSCTGVLGLAGEAVKDRQTDGDGLNLAYTAGRPRAIGCPDCLDSARGRGG